MALRTTSFFSATIIPSGTPSPHLPSSIFFFSTNNKFKAIRSKSNAVSGMKISASLRQPLDLTEDNVKQVLVDALDEFGHIFDRSIGMTGEVELSEVDGPFVKISLRGRFWHERSMVLARLGNYLKQRIPEILEVDIEDEKQLDDSPENF